jgi:hypothetical protein
MYRPTHQLEVVVTFRPGRFTPEEIVSGGSCVGGWVAPRAGLDATENRGKYCCCRQSNSDSSAVHTVASRYTD